MCGLHRRRYEDVAPYRRIVFFRIEGFETVSFYHEILSCIPCNINIILLLC